MKYLICLVCIFGLIVSGCATTDVQAPLFTLEREGMDVAQTNAIQKISVYETQIVHELYATTGELTQREVYELTDAQQNVLQELLAQAELQNYESELVYENAYTRTGMGSGTVTFSDSDQVVRIEPYILENIQNEALSQLLLQLRLTVSSARDAQSISRISYQAMQCQLAPWSQTNPDLDELQRIVMHYRQNHIVFLELDSLQFTGMVCQACDICPSTQRIIAEVYTQQLAELEADGWVVIAQSP